MVNSQVEKLKLLHTADWQIGRQYGRFAPEDAAVLAEARLSVVARIAEMAAREEVAAVLVAGDVFDAQTVSDRTIRRLFNTFQAFDGPWILIPGNHDAALAESVWTRARKLSAIPRNAHVLLEPEVREFPEAGFAVLAAPLTQRHTSQDLTAWFDTARTTPGLYRVGIAHGSVQGVLDGALEASNPIAGDRAGRARLDYLALGDWHGLKRIDARTWYSGTPEQERFKDNGAGQVLLVTLGADGQEPDVRPMASTQYQWTRREIVLSVDSDLEELLHELDRLPEDAVCQLILSGQVDLAGARRLEAALSVAQARCRSLQCEQSALRLLPTDEDLAVLRADGYLGEVVAELRARQQAGAASPGATSDDAGQQARDALAILAGLLHDQHEAGESA